MCPKEPSPVGMNTPVSEEVSQRLWGILGIMAAAHARQRDTVTRLRLRAAQPGAFVF